MLNSWTVVILALAYVGVLYLVASYGDRKVRHNIGSQGKPRPLIYALSLAVYCTSWTFFGSVGLSSRTGWDFVTIYLGPILVFALGWPLLRYIVQISKRQNITSIADFISARYGKNRWLGALVALIAVIGIVPYISLQLKAIAVSLQTILSTAPAIELGAASATLSGSGDNFALLVTVTLAGFAMLFGTRHIDTTEHQDGLILAIAIESVIKLVAFLAVGIFATFWVLGGIDGLFAAVTAQEKLYSLFTTAPSVDRWITMTLLSSFAIFLLPRQFHVTVVENTAIEDVKRAAWLFPLYLVAINLFVAPIAIAGLVTFQSGNIDGDSFVLALPVASGHRFVVFAAFIGGLSAATAMVIVETIALSIMVCNNLVVPLILKKRALIEHSYGEIGSRLILIRRVAIFAVLALAYGYYQMIAVSSALAQIGLLSFAAAAQFAPAFFGGLIWKRANARGAMAGIIAGFTVWVYTLALPLFANAGWIPNGFVENGLFNMILLKPQALFGLTLEPLTHGVLWSLGANLFAYIAFSLSRSVRAVEAIQAEAFLTPELSLPSTISRTARSNVTAGQLQETVARYLGEERTQRSYVDYEVSRGLVLNPSMIADEQVIRFTENLLARAVGSSSARLVLALLLESHTQTSSQATRLLGQASDALRHNRDLLQSAIDHVRQGIAVFDNQLNLICWNRQFRLLLDLPVDQGRVGVPLSELLRQVLASNGYSDDKIENELVDRISWLSLEFRAYHEPLPYRDIILDVRSSKMPDGGIVVTFADISETVDAQAALVQVNETLEKRVEERTAALTSLNHELEKARAEAEAANIGKTRFVAAASHDILQPLNAAKLFAASLVERTKGGEDEKLVRNVDDSLEAVEEILNALLEISKLDAGAMRAVVSTFPIEEILTPLRTELTPLAKAKGLGLTILPCDINVVSDRQLLRRLVQNLVSNAIKYTANGRVLVGCRRVDGHIKLSIFDTGPGIAPNKQETIFREFTRLNETSEDQPGIGLGLSIVKRIAKVLNHDLTLASKLGRGSQFSIRLPLGHKTVRKQAPARRPQLTTASVSNLSVLIIDNDAAIIEGMTILLSGWGCRVYSAQNQQQAFDYLEHTGKIIDLVLVDYHLDKGTGLELLGAIREKLQLHLPSILITADRTRNVIDTAKSQNIGYLSKPVKPAGLRAAIAHTMAQSEAAE